MIKKPIKAWPEQMTAGRTERVKAEKLARKKADRRHLDDGRKTRKKRRDIKRSVKEKTDEYGRELEDKFENELSYEEKEQLREEDYAREVQNRRRKLEEEI